MPLDIPSVQTIFDRKASDVITELNDLDPFLRNSLLRAQLVGDSNTASELYNTLLQLQILTFWDTTFGTELERWAAIYGINRNAATIATGAVTFTGVNSTLVPLNTTFSATNGEQYQTTVAKTITTTVIPVSSVTRSGSTVTVTTTIDHGLASSMSVVIAGATETDYNGTQTIVVTGLDTFTYTISATPSTPATGTITATATYANIACESLNFGSNANLESGDSVSLSSPIAGVDDPGRVSYVGITGGTDEESDDSLRTRFLFKLQNPIANFNANAIKLKALEVSGTTRVWVQTPDDLNVTLSVTGITRSDVFAKVNLPSHGLFDGQIVTIAGANETEYNLTDVRTLLIDDDNFGYIVSGSPTTPATGTITADVAITSPGQVRVFFVRDNDGSGSAILPSAGEVLAVLNKILEIKPAQVVQENVIVNAPTANTVDFTFTALSPNTTAMQTAITASLESFFASGTNVAEDLTEDTYKSIIKSTQDSGGNTVDSFTLSSPSGDVSIGVSELPILGTITF